VEGKSRTVEGGLSSGRGQKGVKPGLDGTKLLVLQKKIKIVLGNTRHRSGEMSRAKGKGGGEKVGTETSRLSRCGVKRNNYKKWLEQFNDQKEGLSRPRKRKAAWAGNSLILSTIERRTISKKSREKEEVMKKPW